jgi:cobalt-zinc-cadmium efflux system protein
LVGHGHRHGAARHRPRLAIALALTLGVLVLEAVVAVATGSLVLLADAGHLLTDAVGLGLALAAITAAARHGGGGQHSFGLYRLEILAALANAVLLLGVGGWVLVEAVRRLGDPPVVPGVPLLAVAAAGLAANLVAYALLREGARDNLNVRGAALEVLADTLGSVAVLAAALIVATTGWPYADPLFGVAIGVLVVPRAVRLGWQALRVLLQAAPPQLPVAHIARDLAGLPGVVDVHDLHVWTLTSSMDVASAHVMVRPGVDPHGVLDEARDLLRDRYRIAHATLQVEPDTHQGCEEVRW